MKVRRSLVRLAAAAACIVSFLFPSPAAPASQADFLTASGCSVSNVGYLTDLAREYERRKGVRIYVRGGGSVVGIEDLRSGKVDFAASCRNKEKGDPEDIQFIQVAWDALVFVVHRSNPVDRISLDQARAIYAGQIINWKQLGGRDARIKTFVSRPRKGLSGVEASIRSMVLKGREPAATPNTVFLASTGIVEQMVEDTPEGFATTGFTSARKRDLKMLRLDGVAPTVRSIVARRYPLKRPLYIILPRNPKPEVRKFVDFVVGREGQQIIRNLGVVALTEMQ